MLPRQNCACSDTPYGQEGVLHKGHDAKGREGRRRTRRETEGETLSLSRAPPTFAPSLARPLFALGAARQIATGGKEGKRRRGRRERRCHHHRGLAISTPRHVDDIAAVDGRGRIGAIKARPTQVNKSGPHLRPRRAIKRLSPDNRRPRQHRCE